MIEAGCRALHDAQGTGDPDAPLHSPPQNSWEEPDSVRWKQWRETITDDVWPALVAAAPASPLPGGGWKPSRNDVARRCDPKAWEFYDRHIDNPIMGAECRAEVAASIRMADAILALPAAPTGDACNGKGEG